MRSINATSRWRVLTRILSFPACQKSCCKTDVDELLSQASKIMIQAADEIKAAAIEAGAEVPQVSEYLMTVVDELKATTCTLKVDALIIRVSAELVQILNTIKTAASSVDAKALAANASE